ncbi:MAG: hypothetical protein ACRCYS_07185, partial [Beijerinckiaceae bacterium]
MSQTYFPIGLSFWRSARHIAGMVKPPKDPARPTRSKASKPALQPLEGHLAQLLNPGIGRGTAGPGTAASDRSGFGEAPQAGFDTGPLTGVDPRLAKALGLNDPNGEHGAGAGPAGGKGKTGKIGKTAKGAVPARW